MKPFTLFIGSSSEGRPIAEAFAAELDTRPFFKAMRWWTAFSPNTSFFDDLIMESQRVDFGIFIATDDDLTISRGTAKEVARDNVLFEFALFVGQLGKSRVILARTVESLPSDLDGITTVRINQNPFNAADLVDECIRKLFASRGRNRCSELLFQVGRSTRSRTGLESRLAHFHQEISLHAMPSPPSAQAANAVAIFRRIRTKRDKVLPDRRNRASRGQPYFELSAATHDDIRKLSSIVAAQIIEAARKNCAQALCATRVAIWKGADPNNLPLLEAAIEQCGLRPILVDDVNREVLGPYTQGEKVVLAYDFLNTGFTPLQCTDTLRENGLIVNHVVALCARQTELANALRSAQLVNVSTINCFLIKTNGEVRPHA